jgi:hypothetical protein
MGTYTYLVQVIFCLGVFSLLESVTGDENDPEEFKLPNNLVNFDELYASKEGAGFSRSTGNYLKADVAGAELGKPCDDAFYTKYTLPLYNANTRDEFTNLMQAFLQQLKADSTLEGKSCFTHISAKENSAEVLRFMKCESGVCACYTDEPYKSTKVNGECVIEKATVGSPCNRSRTGLLNARFYQAFRDGINAAQTATDFKKVVTKFGADIKMYLDYDSLESDRRRACFNYEKDPKTKLMMINPENLECSEAGECECVSSGKRFSYTTADRTCKAKKDAICVLDILDNRLSNVGCSEPGRQCSKVGKKLSKRISLTVCDPNPDGATSTIPPNTTTLLVLMFITLGTSIAIQK